uniref:G-protein coupled receptors family 1 profile domain-containing protein n=1 Tax=Ciona savignyi TaxID=51511 RepID=H2YES8_CIOSA
NASWNATDSRDETYSGDGDYPTNQEAALAAIIVPIFFSLIFCVGLIGNSLVITVMMKMYRYQAQHGLNNTNRFILNLAISDLFFLIFCVPFQATIYSLPSWPFGSFMCSFCEVCQNVTMIASIFTLVALSFDRFFAVVYATSAKQLRTRTNANRGLIFIWVAAVGIGTPSALTRAQVGGLLIQPPRCDLQDLVIVFTINWFPHHLVAMWTSFGDFPYTSETFVLLILGHCLSYANSCLNPLVYAFVSNRFRADFKK